ncbi:MAG: riboflavin synthase [Candidatus Cyclobacteriaceae bacterium M3_2C_046]
MFTGIVETVGIIKELKREGTNTTYWVQAPFTRELQVNQSVSHNGVCLTITDIKQDLYSVTAVDETLKKSNLGDLEENSEVNLERSMSSGYRFDGHIVQGHVDQTGICTNVKEMEGSWLYDFEYEPATGNFLVEKGSVCIDGVSLTVFNTEKGKFRVTIIPHTYEVTVFKHYQVGTRVNLEFDIIGKYIQKLFSMGYIDYLKDKIK